VLRRHGATGGQWHSPGFAAATSVDVAAGWCRLWTVALPSTCLEPAMGRGCAGRRPGGRPVGTVLGRCGATGDVQWRSRGFAVVARVEFGASRFWSILAGSSRPTAPTGRADFGQVDEIDLAVFSITDVGGRSRTVAVTELSWRGLSGAGGVLRQPPKPAQVSRSYRGLPGYFQEYLCGHRLVWLCHCHALLYVCDVITCTCILREAPFGAELGEFLVGSSRGVAICGVVRACTLQGREHCAGGGVRRQNVAREAHGGFKSLLASRLRPLSSKATHPPNDRSLHIRTPAPAPGRVSRLHNRAGGGGGPVRVTART